MPLRILKREVESPMQLLFRFTKKVQHAGVLKEARGRRTRKRAVNKTKRRLSALHREGKRAKIALDKKMGVTVEVKKRPSMKF